MPQIWFLFYLAGELLKKAEHLLIVGLHSSEIIKGYELASEKAQAELESTSAQSLVVETWTERR